MVGTGWRTSESMLFGLALIGGWPGALIAQRHFHHKTLKSSFQTVFWVVVVLNIGLFGVVLTNPLQLH
jgi:uncharacterized membrane protein YsdA (DUF1294 family)